MTARCRARRAVSSARAPPVPPARRRTLARARLGACCGRLAGVSALPRRTAHAPRRPCRIGVSSSSNRDRLRTISVIRSGKRQRGVDHDLDATEPVDEPVGDRGVETLEIVEVLEHGPHRDPGPLRHLQCRRTHVTLVDQGDRCIDDGFTGPHRPGRPPVDCCHPHNRRLGCHVLRAPASLLELSARDPRRHRGDHGPPPVPALEHAGGGRRRRGLRRIVRQRHRVLDARRPVPRRHRQRARGRCGPRGGPLVVEPSGRPPRCTRTATSTTSSARPPSRPKDRCGSSATRPSIPASTGT